MSKPMKIAVVNPNTTASMTEKIAVAARGVAGQGTQIIASNPVFGPVSIEGYYDEALAIPGLLQELAKAERNGVDAAVIACFDDCGLDAARSLLRIPVIGICEAAIRVASMLGTRFSIVTTLPISLPAMAGLVQRYGVADRCTIRAAGVPVLALEDPNSGAEEVVKSEILRAIQEDRSECILLGCAGMADLAGKLTRACNLPVIDGVTAAVKLAEALVGLGLKTSKQGGFAMPPSKMYQGIFGTFAPDVIGR